MFYVLTIKDTYLIFEFRFLKTGLLLMQLCFLDRITLLSFHTSFRSNLKEVVGRKYMIFFL